ncbi:MAG: sulfotransferase, partial [Pseudomonadota bacterium]
NWHLAGLAKTPIYALMNAKTHWYWGPDGRVANVYPKAVTVPRHDARRRDIGLWIEGAEAAFRARSAPTTRRADSRKGPVLITGAPRSGTSMVAGCLHQAGLWMGATIRATPDNPLGFFENWAIRETILKPNLARSGADPLGVWALPDPDRLAPDPLLRQRVERALAAQGFAGDGPWGYKEPKLCLVWPTWAEAFPDATWVLVDRAPEAIVRSCLRTGFMRRHSCDPEFWRCFVNRYRDRMDDLSRSAPNVVRISADALVGGARDPIRELATALGLSWTDRCEARIAPKHFTRF